ncbi:30S ribosomal protein S17 [Candidatus Kaiserbacteria bacterium RIFCSPLOWO2_01_FULL_53_17]|uniref:Small ribosomal subunit protein uS17 n=1 Tax=Candidatus Kaiserbacteria bacterium RIFCSPLOWO2_01_FULL_53_17 TaxID=1798511 RepID=A0A1F6EI25_9BACT|nr:MAG: 30S ribosomal protein S17 [Candidatus Kaiserbacteria bacterium RIFCSPLOWO2_01_FULL_53_17]
MAKESTTQTKQSLPAGRQGKILEGVVVKSAMKDTATVEVSRYEKHPKYEKYLRRTKKFLVHDVGNTAKVGDKVRIQETRPISKNKHFILLSISSLASTSDQQLVTSN